MDSTLTSTGPQQDASSLNRARRAALGSFAGAVVDVVFQHLRVPLRKGALVAKMFQHGSAVSPVVAPCTADLAGRDGAHQLGALGRVEHIGAPAADEG